MEEKLGLKCIGGNTFEGKRLAFVSELKAYQGEDGFYYISGYANTKNTPDSYGDIPYNLNGAPVYDLSRITKNPVMLVDHCVSVGHIMGMFTQLFEDEKGLFFTAKLIDINDAYTEIVQHAIACYIKGFARALSIGGVWEYNDPENKSHLTTARIFEISGVAVGADENALVIEKPGGQVAPMRANALGVRDEIVKKFLRAKAQKRSVGNVGINTVY